MKYEIGKKRMYSRSYSEYMGREDVISWEVLDIKNHSEIEVEFLSANYPFDHGVYLAMHAGKGYLEIEGATEKGKVLMLDQNDNYTKVRVKCFSEEGVLSVYTFFYLGPKENQRRTQMDFSGMLVEENDNVFTYRCNHWDRNGDFTDLVFRIILL